MQASDNCDQLECDDSNSYVYPDLDNVLCYKKVLRILGVTYCKGFQGQIKGAHHNR